MGPPKTLHLFWLASIISSCNISFTLSLKSSKIKITDTENLFNKYWDMLKKFHNCTIHFPLRPNTRLELYYSLYDICFTNNYLNNLFFVTLHSTDASSGNNSSFDLEDLTNIFPTAFAPLKFVSFCIVQLPSVPSIPNVIPFYFYHPENLKPEFNFESGRHHKIADYLLIPSSISSPIKLKSTRIAVGPYLNSQSIIIFFNEPYFGIFLTCVYCAPVEMSHNTEIRNIPLMNLFSKASSRFVLPNIHYAWMILHFKMDYPIVPRVGSQVPNVETCPYRKRAKIHTFSPDNLSVQECIKDIITISMKNCSLQRYCIDTANAMFSFENIETVNTQKENRIILSFGAQFHGIRFSIFVKEEDKSLNTVKAFAYPYSIEGWITVTITIILLAFTLMMTSHFKGKGGESFWIFISVFEQGDVQGLNVKNRANWHLFLLWLYTALLLRNVYTSSLFSYMTKQVEPSGIPTSFTELLNETGDEIKLLTARSTSVLLDNHHHWLTEMVTDTNIPKTRRDNAKKIVSTLEDNMNDRMWCLIEPYKAIKHAWKMHKNADVAETAEWSSCSPTKLNPDVRFKIKMWSRPENLKCLKWEKFAFLFDTKPGKFHDLNFQSVFLKGVLALYGEKYDIYENNDPTVFTQIWLWQTAYRKIFLLKSFEKSLSALVESGIYSFQFHYYELIVQWMSLLRLACHENYKCKRFHTTINHLAFVNKMTTKFASLGWSKYQKETLRGIHHRNDEDTNILVHNKHLYTFWVISGFMVVICTGVFICEIILQYRLSKQEKP